MANGVTKANTQSVNQRKRDEEEEARRQSQARKRQEEEMKRQQAEMKRQQEEAARQQEAERKRQAESSRKNSERRNQTNSKVTPDASIPVLDPKYASPEAIERGREFGRKALADVKAGRVTSNDPLGYARGLPGMSEVYKAQAAAEEAQAQAEAEARQQWESYRDRMLAENASRNAQRRGQLSAQSTTMPMEQNMSGQMPTQDVQTITNGAVDVLGTRREHSDLTAAAQSEIADLERKRDRLLKYNGYGNDRKAQAIQDQIDTIRKNGFASNEDYLVSRNRYDNLMSDNELADDIDKLTQIIYNPRRAGGNASANAVSQRLTEMDAQDYIANLSDKYGLSEAELRDMALTRHAEDRYSRSDEYAGNLYDFAKKHPKLGEYASVLGTIGNGVEGAYNLAAGALTGDNRYLSDAFRDTKQGLRQGTIDSHSTAPGKFLSQMKMGLEDLGVGVLTGNAPLMLAGNTANEAMLGAVENGQTARKAALYGGLSGAADYYMNKVGLDAAKEQALEGVGYTVKDILKRLGIASGVEAGENVIQDITQSFIDNFVNGERSELKQAYAQKIADGMSESDAFKETAIDYAKQLLMSGATGAVMGAGMMGGQTAKNAFLSGVLEDALNQNSKRFNEKFEEWKANRVPQVEEQTAELNPVDLARQNEADIPAMEAQAEQARAEIQRLAEEVPEVPEERLTPEEVEALKRGNEAMEAPKESPAEAFDRERKEAIATLSEADKRNVRATIRNSDIGTRSYPDVDLKDRAAARQYWNEATEEARRAYELFDPDSPEAYYAAEVISARMADLEKSYKQALNAADNSELPWFNPNPKGDLAAIESRINDRFSRFDVSGNEELSQLKNDITDAVNDLYDAIDGTDIGAVNDANKRLTSLIGKFDRRAKKEFENYKAIGGRDVSRPAWRYEQLNTPEPELTDEEFSDLFGGKSARPTEPEVPAVEEIADQTAKQADEIPAVAAADGNIPPENGEVTNEVVNPSGDKGLRRTYTNTGVKSGVVDPYDLENDPVTMRNAEYDIHHEADTTAKANDRVAKNADMWREQYSSGTKKIDTDVDMDTGMILLKDKNTSKWQSDSILRNIAEHGTEAGQFIEAFKKWANTGVGALAKAAKIDNETVKNWTKKNVKLKERNNRIAKAISLIGEPEPTGKGKPTPLTHDELKEQIIKTINDAFGEDASKFNDDDIEYLTILAETKKVPVRTITKELEHKLDTGEWFTIDESLPIKVEKAIKNGTISNMLDRIVNGEQPKAEKEPEAYGKFLAKIRNSLQDEEIGLGDEFDDTDVYFLGKLIQEKIPKKTIEEELRHRIETGEWFTIDESIEAPKPTNQKLQNAFKKLLGPDIITQAEPKTFDQIRDEVRNTLEKEEILDQFSDSDVDYLSNLIQNGMSTDEIAKALHAKSATGRWGISEETQQAVNERFEYAHQYNENSREYVEAVADAYRLLAEEVAPNASALEKFDTWRYMAMLGNTKTMFRNWVGNKLFSAVTGASNNLAAAMEHGADWAYNKATGEHIQRTKEFLNPVKDKALIDAAAKDAEASRYAQVEGSKYERMDKDSLKNYRSAFNSKLMQLYEKAVDKGISDTKAVIDKYSTSLAGYMKANGMDVSDIDNSYKYDALYRKSRTKGGLDDKEFSEMARLKEVYDRMEKARDYALKQAEYATFHKDNKVASVLSKWSRTSRADGIGLGSLLIEGTVPFKKTPANILEAGFEYSPFGAIKSIAETGKLIVENTGKRKGNLENEYTWENPLTGKKHDIKKTLASDVIESWSKTLTGSALAYLGYYLFDKGILNSSEKDEKYQDQLEGKQNYSININGHNITLDWAAPGVMPLLLGAEIKKVFTKNGKLDEEWYSHPDEWIRTVNALLDPALETSFMSGVKDSLNEIANTVRFGGDEDVPGGIIGSTIGNAVTGYFTQAIPTVSGQIARTIDPIRRTTDTKSSNAFMSALEKQARKAANKIPFLSMINPEYRDAYGRGQTNSPFEYKEGEYGLNILKGLGNFAYQSLSPAYYSKENVTDADRLGRELYDMTDENGHYIEGVSNDSGVFADWRSTKKIDGQKLDPQQMQTFRENMGQTNKGLREELYNSDWYYELDPKAQRDLVNSLNTIADKVGQYSVMPGSVNQEDADLSAYIAAGGGKEGVKAIVNNLAGKAYVSMAGVSSSSTIAKAIKEAAASGNMDLAKQLSESGKKFTDIGLPTRGQSLYTGRGHENLPEFSPEEYANVYSIADKDGNGEITQAELKESWADLGVKTTEQAQAYWKGLLDDFSEKTKIPVVDANGTFSYVSQASAGDNAQTTQAAQPTTGQQPSDAQQILQQYSTRPTNTTANELPVVTGEYTPGDTQAALDMIANSGVKVKAPESYWNQAYKANPNITPQEFLAMWQAIDSALGEPNGGHSKDEWVYWLNNNDLDYDGDMDAIGMMYNTRNKPLKYSDGVWRK